MYYAGTCCLDIRVMLPEIHIRPNPTPSPWRRRCIQDTRGWCKFRSLPLSSSIRRPPERTLTVCESSRAKSYESRRASPVVQWIVGLATETLRFVGVGGTASGGEGNDAAIVPGRCIPLDRGDVEGVISALREDFELRAYFVTGVLTDAIYDENCLFVDPTISFSGRELWKRNLQLLTPFLRDPSIDLLSLYQKRAESDQQNGGIDDAPVVLRAEWILKCELKFPWKPYIEVKGATDYTLHSTDNNRIIQHVETWDITGVEALALILSPGGRREREKSER